MILNEMARKMSVSLTAFNTIGAEAYPRTAVLMHRCVVPMC